MSGRSFNQRKRERHQRLRDQAQHVANRMCRPDRNERQLSWDRREFSALMWALEEIDRLDRVEDALSDEALDEDQKLHVIDAICEERYRPTDEDLARTPALARQYVGDEQESTDGGNG